MTESNLDLLKNPVSLSDVFDIAGSVYSRTVIATRVNFEEKCNMRQTTETLAQIKAKHDEMWHEGMKPEEKRQYKDAIAPLKKKLPVFIVSHFPSGERNTGKDPDYKPWVGCVADLDGIEHPDQVWHEQIEPYVKDLKIMAVYRTPSQHGLKVIFLCPSNLTHEEAQHWIADKLGLTEYLDKAAKDNARAHFLVPSDHFYCYRPELMFKPGLNNIGYVVDTADIRPRQTRQSAASPQSATPAQQSAPAQTTAAQASDTTTPSLTAEEVQKLVDAGYHGIPYATIIKTYWDVNNDGFEPTYGDRNTRIYELALAFRYICNNFQLLDAIIPNYDGFPEDEKQATIRSAMSKSRYSMPYKMRDVLDKLKTSADNTPELLEAIGMLEEQYEESPYQQLIDASGKELPMGIRDSMESVPVPLRMSMLIGTTPMIGALATEVRLCVHNVFYKINLQVYIVGEAASGKSYFDSIYQAWMFELKQGDLVLWQMEKDYRALPTKKQEQTPKPVLAYRLQPSRCSIADLIDHLEAVDGKHLFMFSAELDQLTDSRRSSKFSDISVLLREAYDGSEYYSSHAGIGAKNARIEHVHLNTVFCTTPDGLHRAISNVTDGELTRISIATTPDNTFAPLVITKPRSEQAQDNIKQVAHLLTLMKGDVEVPGLEARCCKWIEELRLETLKDCDKVRADQRKRTPISTMRIVFCIMLCAYAEWLIKKLDRHGRRPLPKWADGCETAEQFLITHPDAIVKQIKAFDTETYHNMFDVIANYLVENTLHFFRKRIENAYDSEDYTGTQRQQHGSNDTVFDQLPQEFTLDQAFSAKKASYSEATSETAKQMVRHWREQGLIENIDRGRYRKK